MQAISGGQDSAERKRAADTFERQVQPREGVDYGWVSRFALDATKATFAGATALDAKAERLIAFTAAAGSLFAAFMTKGSPWVSMSALPALVLAFAAVYQALHALRPRVQAELPTIVDAWGYAEFFRDEGESAFIAKLNQAREYQHAANTEKALHLDRAFRLGFWSLAALLLPVVAAILTH